VRHLAAVTTRSDRSIVGAHDGFHLSFGLEKDGMTRRGCGVVVAALLGCAPGCEFGELPDHSFLERDTTITNGEGQPQPLAGDDLHAPGIPLKPGDVIYLTRWSPGAIGDAGTLPTNRVNRTSPPAFSSRIPLRKIRTGGALYDYEREFLLDALNTNRKALFGIAPGTPGQAGLLHAIANLVRDNEAVIWNAFVEGLRVHRFLQPGQAPILTVTFSPSMIASELKANGAMFTHAFGPPDAGQPDAPEFDIIGVSTPRDPEATMIDQADTHAEAYYFGPAGLVAAETTHLHTFVTVELGGLDVHTPQWPESQWSLRDWEASDVCQPIETNGGQDRSYVYRITLKHGVEAFQIHGPEHENDVWPTHRIQQVISANRRGRRLETVSWNRVHGYYLDEPDLDRLTVGDLDQLMWITRDKSTHGVIVTKGARRLHPRNCDILP
jgi:hypothetical protein